MAIDPACAAHRAGLHGSAADLAVEVHRRSRSVIDAELHRLARRVPSLRLADLNVIDTSLEDLAESLVLARLRNVPQEATPLLRRLFDT